MTLRRSTLVVSIVVLAGCAGTPAPELSPPKVVEVPSSTRSNTERLREELSAAHDLISNRPVAPPSIQDEEALASMDLPSHRSIPRSLNYFKTGLHDKIQESLNRSAEYRIMIDRVLREYDLPAGLAYLPVIESAYVPTITSRAGAHGIWQFVPATAREYGLRVDWWIDERADPEESTRAAAAYLSDLYEMFGDWPLALAAYNGGPGRIRRAMKRYGATSFWQLLDQRVIPKETQGYVPTFYATLQIARDPEEHGFYLLAPRRSDGGTVFLEGPVSLRYISSLIGIDELELADRNPALRHSMIPPGIQKLRVPSISAKALQARAGSLRYEDPYVAAAIYTANRGDSVASLAKRFRLDRRQVRSMNGMTSDRIREGERVYLPITQPELSFRLGVADPSGKSFYLVKTGDTLLSIAQRVGLTLDELVSLNEITPDEIIHPGDRLKIRVDASKSSP